VKGLTSALFSGSASLGSMNSVAPDALSASTTPAPIRQPFSGLDVQLSARRIRSSRCKVRPLRLGRPGCSFAGSQAPGASPSTARTFTTACLSQHVL